MLNYADKKTSLQTSGKIGGIWDKVCSLSTTDRSNLKFHHLNMKLSKKWSEGFCNYSHFQMTTVKGQECWRFVLNCSFSKPPWFLLKPLLIYGNFGFWRHFLVKITDLSRKSHLKCVTNPKLKQESEPESEPD